MGTDTRRLFVGNLPDDIQEQELKNEFSAYGSVRNVEVKHKKEPDSDEIISTFAFISIDIDDYATRQCIQEFKQEKFRGKFLQVTVARENFLEKLKREREEASQLAGKKQEKSQPNSVEFSQKVELPTIKSSKETSSSSSSSSESEDEPEVQQHVAKSNGKKPQSSSSDDSDSSDDESNLILKKQSRKSLENGKIKIDSSLSGGKAIHVIERNTSKANSKCLDEKSKKADQRRIESMKKMKNSYNEQKMAIKNALTSVDSAKSSNKIIFDDDDDGNVSHGAHAKVNAFSKKENNFNEKVKKPKLFGDDGDEEDENENYQNDFKIKEQFQGAKGERLMRLQTRFQGDRRFAMDSKFLEDDDNEMDVDVKTTVNRTQNGQNKHDEDANEERNWQYNILESVIGKKLRHDQPPKDPKKKTVSSMLRFDPTRADHEQFEEEKGKKKRKKQNIDNEIVSKKSKLNENNEENIVLPSVSMDQFYEVRSDLKQSMGVGGFSLLSMFGRSENAGENKNTDNKAYEEKPIAKNTAKFLADLDPFKYDSSDDEAGSESKEKKSSSLVTKKDVADRSKISHESFFLISSNDERLKEGTEFFLPPDNRNDVTDENNEEKKQQLRNIVKRKIKKSVQNALPKHAKPNRRLKKFTKNL